MKYYYVRSVSFILEMGKKSCIRLHTSIPIIFQLNWSPGFNLRVWSPRISSLMWNPNWFSSQHDQLIQNSRTVIVISKAVQINLWFCISARMFSHKTTFWFEAWNKHQRNFLVIQWHRIRDHKWCWIWIYQQLQSQ